MCGLLPRSCNLDRGRGPEGGGAEVQTPVVSKCVYWSDLCTRTRLVMADFYEITYIITFSLAFDYFHPVLYSNFVDF